MSWEDEAKAEVAESMFESIGDVLQRARERINKQEGDVLLECGFPGFELSAGKVTVLGAPPGMGKTALAMQIAYDVAVNHSSMPVVVANAEMSSDALVRRELSRRSGVFFWRIRFADYLPGQEEQVLAAAEEIGRSRNIEFLKPEHCCINALGTLCRREEKGLLVVDYLQLFRDMEDDSAKALEKAMAGLCDVAMSGWAVLAISALNRTSTKSGKYSDVGMTSFRGSSDIEFRGSTAYTLGEDTEVAATGTDKPMLLKCAKNREGDTKNFKLTFCPLLMQFTSADEPIHKEFAEYSGGRQDG